MFCLAELRGRESENTDVLMNFLKWAVAVTGSPFSSNSPSTYKKILINLQRTSSDVPLSQEDLYVRLNPFTTHWPLVRWWTDCCVCAGLDEEDAEQDRDVWSSAASLCSSQQLPAASGQEEHNLPGQDSCGSPRHSAQDAHFSSGKTVRNCL